MEDLNKTELMQVNGGNPLLIGVGIGIAGNYIYDAMGGKQGIDNYFSKSYQSARSSINY